MLATAARPFFRSSPPPGHFFWFPPYPGHFLIFVRRRRQITVGREMAKREPPSGGGGGGFGFAEPPAPNPWRVSYRVEVGELMG
jgi:hypothetical protein